MGLLIKAETIWKPKGSHCLKETVRSGFSIANSEQNTRTINQIQNNIYV